VLPKPAGAVGLVFLVFVSGHWEMADGAVGANAVKIAAAKAALPFSEAFFKGTLCNILVCLAVWLALAARSVVDKIFAIIFPISAFVAAGFEHSIANMYFIPLGILLRDRVGKRRKSFLGRTLVQPRAGHFRQYRWRQSNGSSGLPFRLPPHSF
jgi:formate/nitrite transporter FocA (FNT family)